MFQIYLGRKGLCKRKEPVKLGMLRYLYPNVRDTVYSGEIIQNGKIYRNITVQGTAYVPAGKNPTIKAIENIDVDEAFHTLNRGDMRAYVLPADEGDFNYDAIGNLIFEHNKGVTIQWTPYGKVRQVTQKDGTVMSFCYDATGNRIEKKLVKPDNSTIITRYVRDASGNVMAVYDGTAIKEMPIYGSSRTGMYKGGRSNARRTLGTKSYELSNHLGNVLSVITDNIRMAADSAWATVVASKDYYIFGSDMPARQYIENDYRYGFNGKEKDGQGEWGDTSYDYGFRVYNPRIAKFLSVDPLTKEYPWYTPYQFAGNSPIIFIDLDGLEPTMRWATMTFERYGNRVVPWSTVHQRTEAQQAAAMKHYHELQNKYAIVKDGNLHAFHDKFALNRILKRHGVTQMSQLDSEKRTLIMKQFQELRDAAKMVLELYDQEYFNAQYTQLRYNKMVMEAARDEQVAVRSVERDEAISSARWQGFKMMVYGGAALVTAPVEEVGSGGFATLAVWVQVILGTDNLSGGLARVLTPEDYVEGDMPPIKYLLTRGMGAGGSYVYDIIDISSGLHGAMKANQTLEVIGAAETMEDITDLKTKLENDL